MKKLVIFAIALAFAAVLGVQAADAGAKKLSPEAKALRKEMMTKYDTNGDKKLDKDELAKISADDKKKMQDAGIWPKERKAKTQ